MLTLKVWTVRKMGFECAILKKMQQFSVCVCVCVCVCVYSYYSMAETKPKQLLDVNTEFKDKHMNCDNQHIREN